MRLHLTEVRRVIEHTVLRLILVEIGDSDTYKSSPVTGLEWPKGFQEVKVPRFHDNGTVWW
jgi:hypothetical protein